MRVGFAGLGRMGAPMVRNLVAAGHAVTVWNRTTAAAEALAEETGCAVAAAPVGLTDGCEVVVTMLADDAASEAVHLGPGGLFAGRGASVFLEMGTMSPGHIASLVQRVPDGARVIDAPVSGATQAAAEAALLIMAGCTEAEAAPVMPVLEALGRRVICLGAPGRGAVMKLSVNALIHGLNQTLAEAMTLAEATGIDPERAFDVIEASAAAAPMLRYRRPLYLHEADHDVTFTVALARKDMGLMAELAAEHGVAVPQGAVTLETLKAAEAGGYAGRDMAAMLDYMRKTRR
ncbi:NAD(P)-dependent oxidoreductase [Oceaniglobus roseus]|uniref:NAD(P)-dependent oxidoreductase n=1 Tax=Oceaniglobus roseus TaxID=1737570 RepID=UPI000C7EE472|nr:NAD(P)-dependent oxidoreductase [Kandeliimicrobium roseum]